LNFHRFNLVVSIALAFVAPMFAQDASIRVLCDQPLLDISRTMTGACIEDVNHEIYGGLYSQMLFGESFQEPAPSPSIVGFKSYGGSWLVKDGELHAGPGDGPKLISVQPPSTTGDVSVEIMFPDDKPGLAGLILKVAETGVGADRFIGYEVSLIPSSQRLLLGRHRHNWEPIREVPCDFPIGKWVALSVKLTDTSLTINVDGKQVLTFEDHEHPLRSGAIGLRTWQRDARFRALKAATNDKSADLAFRTDSSVNDAVSGMWRSFRRGAANGRFALESAKSFHGTQCQRITFENGEGELGVENRGLNRWGLNVVAGKPYEGYLWLRSETPIEAYAVLQSADGADSFGQARLVVDSPDWKRYDFSLMPSGSATNGRFAFTLRRPGSVVVGHAFLQPGEWGRYKGLPVRRDVAEGMSVAGFTVLRYGGSMVNAPEYRWKTMIGPRDRRPSYKGTWYPHSSNGWGIVDFLDLCEAMTVDAVPAFNLDETPQDMADFVDYANGSADTEWGRRRIQDGRAKPYRLRYMEIGNEEAVDETYWNKFKPIAEAIWAKDDGVVLIVGDFEYKQPITDPFNVEGAPRIKSLAAHKKILDLAKANGREVWFDVHIWNHNPGEALPTIAALGTFGDALAKLSPGAPFKLCVLEENAINHAMRRAIAHAETINGLMRLGGRVKIVCAANGLQPDGQNDNGWDQGLVFLNPSLVWGQPPCYVTQMVSQNFRPRLLKTDATSPGNVLDAVALANVNGRRLTLQVVNRSANPVRSHIQLDTPAKDFVRAVVTQLSGPLDAVNRPDEPQRISSWKRDWTFHSDPSGAAYTFPPYSFTVFDFE